MSHTMEFSQNTHKNKNKGVTLTWYYLPGGNIIQIKIQSDKIELVKLET